VELGHFELANGICCRVGLLVQRQVSIDRQQKLRNQQWLEHA
jgi:hypothetical protein